MRGHRSDFVGVRKLQLDFIPHLDLREIDVRGDLVGLRLLVFLADTQSQGVAVRTDGLDRTDGGMVFLGTLFRFGSKRRKGHGNYCSEGQNKFLHILPFCRHRNFTGDQQVVL